MTFYQSLATVLLRVWAAVYLVQWLSYLISWGIGGFTGSLWADEQSRLYYLTNLAIYVISFLIGVAVWFSAPTLGKRVGGGFSDSALNLGVSSKQLVAIGAFLIGLFFVAEYAPQAGTETVEVFIKTAKETDTERLTGAQRYFVAWGTLAAHWAIVATALVIALRAQDFGRLFSWLRSVGQYRERSAASGEKSALGE